jgi:hypothetical protein
MRDSCSALPTSRQTPPWSGCPTGQEARWSGRGRVTGGVAATRESPCSVPSLDARDHPCPSSDSATIRRGRSIKFCSPKLWCCDGTACGSHPPCMPCALALLLCAPRAVATPFVGIAHEAITRGDAVRGVRIAAVLEHGCCGLGELYCYESLREHIDTCWLEDRCVIIHVLVDFICC